MNPRIYEQSEIPPRTRRGIGEEIQPYLEGLRSGKGVGDGIAYADEADARRVATKFASRAKKALTRADDPYPSMRLWRKDEKTYWALVPSER